MYEMIIEPFAGAAWYSATYPEKKIVLNEKYESLYRLWNWLIKEATREELLVNRNFYVGERVDGLGLCQEHKDLIGFCINRGSSSPRNVVQRWSCQVQSKPDWASTTFHKLGEIADNLEKIRHWEVRLGDYSDLENTEATWFIDPPYQFGGEHYVENKIDY